MLTGQCQETISPEEFEDMDAEVQAALAPFVKTPTITGFKNETNEDPVIYAAIMLSVVEEAIVKATGDSPGMDKPRQCWGCFVSLIMRACPLTCFPVALTEMIQRCRCMQDRRLKSSLMLKEIANLV